MGKVNPSKITVELLARGNLTIFPRLQCPEDFATVYVQLGHKGCQKFYRVTGATVTRWLREFNEPYPGALVKAHRLRARSCQAR